MKKMKALGLGLGSIFAVATTGLGAQTAPVPVIKTGAMEGGENICFGAEEGKLVANRCSWFATRPDAALTYENGRVRPKKLPGVAVAVVGAGGIIFVPGDGPHFNFSFHENYQGTTGWKAMRFDGGSQWGNNCMAVRKTNTSYEIVLHAGTDAYIDPSAGFGVCNKKNLPENQIWFDTVAPPAAAGKPMFLKIDAAVKGDWPNFDYHLAPGEDRSKLARICTGFDRSAQAWVFDRCDKLSADRRDTLLRFGDDQTIRNGNDQCLTRTATVGTEMHFEACTATNVYQRFAFVEKHAGDPLWSALVPTAGPVKGSTPLSGGTTLTASDKPSSACVNADFLHGKVMLGHCETYIYEKRPRTMRAATRTISMQEVPAN